MLGIIAALAAAMMQSLQAAANKKLVGTMPGPALLVRVYAMAAVLVSPLLIFSGIPRLNPTFFVAGTTGALLNISASLFLLEALRRDSISRVFPFLTMAPLFSVLTAFIVLGELPSPQGGVGILLIVAGLMIVEYRALVPSDRSRQHTGVRYAVAAAFLFSLNVAADRLAILHSHPFFYAPFFLGAGAVALLLVWLARPTALAPAPAPAHQQQLLCMSALLLAASTTLTSFALSVTLASYVSALKRFGVLMALVWGGAVLKERITWRLAAGSLLAVSGTLLIALTR